LEAKAIIIEKAGVQDRISGNYNRHIAMLCATIETRMQLDVTYLGTKFGVSSKTDLQNDTAMDMLGRSNYIIDYYLNGDVGNFTLIKTTSHTDNSFKMIIHTCDRDVFQMCSVLSHRFSTWDSMIAEMALVGSDKKVRTTDSPDIHVDDPENETDDAIIPGVGPDGVDPEIYMAVRGTGDPIIDSSGIVQEKCFQIGSIVGFEPGSGMVESRIDLEDGLGTCTANPDESDPHRMRLNPTDKWDKTGSNCSVPIPMDTVVGRLSTDNIWIIEIFYSAFIESGRSASDAYMFTTYAMTVCELSKCFIAGYISKIRSPHCVDDNFRTDSADEAGSATGSTGEDDRSSMVKAESTLGYDYGKMAVDMMCQIHEIISIADEISQLHVHSYEVFDSYSEQPILGMRFSLQCDLNSVATRYNETDCIFSPGIGTVDATANTDDPDFTTAVCLENGPEIEQNGLLRPRMQSLFLNSSIRAGGFKVSVSTVFGVWKVWKVQMRDMIGCVNTLRQTIQNMQPSSFVGSLRCSMIAGQFIPDIFSVLGLHSQIISADFLRRHALCGDQDGDHSGDICDVSEQMKPDNVGPEIGLAIGTAIRVRVCICHANDIPSDEIGLGIGPAVYSEIGPQVLDVGPGISLVPVAHTVTDFGLLRIFTDAIIKTHDVCDPVFGVMFMRVFLLHNNILVSQLDLHKLMWDGFMKRELGSDQLFMLHVDNGGPETYSEFGTQLSTQLSAADRLGPIFGRDVCSTIGSTDKPSYLFSPSAITCFIGYFRDVSVSFGLDVVSDILDHGPVLRDNFAALHFVNVDTVASNTVHASTAHACVGDVSRAILGVFLHIATFKQLLLMNIKLGDDFSDRNISQSAGSSDAACYAMASDQTSTVAFATVNSHMVLLFQLRTQFLSFNSSVSIDYICSPMSKVTDVWTLSVWGLVRYVSTFRLCHRVHHLSGCNFDFNPTISVGGIRYGGDMQYKCIEKTTAQDEYVDNKTMGSHSTILHFVGANNYVMTTYGDVDFEASDMIIIYLEVLSISAIDNSLIVENDVALTSIRGMIIFSWYNINACFSIVNCVHSNRIPAASDCFENVYGYSSAFHSVSWHATMSTWDITNNESVNTTSDLDLIGSARFFQFIDNWILNVSLYFESAHAFVRTVDYHGIFDTTRWYWWGRHLFKLENDFEILQNHRGTEENYGDSTHTALLLKIWIMNSLLDLETTNNIIIAIHYGSEGFKFAPRVVGESYTNPDNFCTQLNVKTSIGGYVTATTVAAPVPIAMVKQFSCDFPGILLRIYYEYHANILRSSCVLSYINVCHAILVSSKITGLPILHVVYFEQFCTYRSGIDSYAFGISIPARYIFSNRIHQSTHCGDNDCGFVSAGQHSGTNFNEYSGNRFSSDNDFHFQTDILTAFVANSSLSLDYRIDDHSNVNYAAGRSIGLFLYIIASTAWWSQHMAWSHRQQFTRQSFCFYWLQVSKSSNEYTLSLLGMMLFFHRICLHFNDSFYSDIDITTSVRGYVIATTVTAPVLVATKSQFSHDYAGTLLRMYHDYHINILRISCELSCTNVYMAILALCEITISALLHVVYFARSCDRQNGIDSCAFDDANSDQSSVFIRRSCINLTLDTNEIGYTTSIGGCDTETTTTTTAPAIATTATTAKRHNLANHWNGG
jgi:hypothetical protein